MFLYNFFSFFYLYSSFEISLCIKKRKVFKRQVIYSYKMPLREVPFGRNKEKSSFAVGEKEHSKFFGAVVVLTDI